MQTKFQTEIRAIHRSDIKNAPYNPRIHGKHAQQAVKDNIKRHGLMSTLTWNERTGNLVGGHMRLKQLDALESKTKGDYTLSVSVVNLSDKEEKEQNIFLNSTKVQGEYDVTALAELMQDLDTVAAGLDSIDFGSPEIDSMFGDVEKPEKKTAREWVPDLIFESNNSFDIPTLKLSHCAKQVGNPFVPYGYNSRDAKNIGTYHFYVDDYRFNAIWDNPTKIINSGCSGIVEPNLSLFDTTPIAYGIHLIYKKRWIARYLQSFGIGVFVDLNVSYKFSEYNVLGVPVGWHSFATRGYSDRIEGLEKELALARAISNGSDNFTFIVYGGGKKVKEVANSENITYIEQVMTDKNR
jgi:hypothetical protein